MKIFMVCAWFLIFPAGTAGLADFIQDPERLESLPAPDDAYYKYLKARRLKCMGDGASIKAQEMKLGKRRFRFDGHKLSALDADSDGKLILGILGAVKDYAPSTREALDHYMRQFEKAGVDALLLLGDIASTESEMTQIMLHCAQKPWPVLALIGNTEGRTAFNRAVLAALKVAPNLVNMDLVRRVDLGGARLVSLPGYSDRSFVHGSSGCTYKPRDVKALDSWVAGGSGPVVLLSHGPPAGKGKGGLDWAVEAGNVGDPVMAGWMKEHKVVFGLFSHILEAGGRAINGAGKRVADGQVTSSLMLNVGSANPLPWQLNGGKSSCGMGAIFTLDVKSGKASHRFVHLKCP
ncbi:MAG: hypothetical protein JRF33_15455 [Deltaproteobacteria bacterium]|nr:hypothetical protein [Deltaproteobacteria bacterium]